MTLATLTALSSIVRKLCALPLIPTQDWCDRAASALAGSVDPSTVVLAGVGWRPGQGSVTIEALGIGVSGATGSAAAINHELRHRAPSLSKLVALFELAHQDSIGESGVLVSTGGASQCDWLWGGLGIGDRIVAIARGGWAPDRWLVCLLGAPAAGGPINPVAVLLLRAALEELAPRAAIALAPVHGSHRNWITPREGQVLDLLITGKSVREAARTLGRSQHTVHDHVKSLYRKLNTKSRGELVARALGHAGHELQAKEPAPAAPLEPAHH